MTLEESIASQNVTEIIIPGLENMPEPVLPDPKASITEPERIPEPEEIVPPPEFRIIEKEVPQAPPNPEDVVRPVFDTDSDDMHEIKFTPAKEDEPVVLETSMQEIVLPERSEPAPVVEEPVVEEPEKEEPAKEEPKAPEYKFPPTSLLKKGTAGGGDSKSQLDETAALLVSTLESFGVMVKLLDVSCGPTVTRYELEPDTGVKVSKIISLADDIKLKLAAPDIRIEAPIPGKAAIGIEVPNKHNVSVMLRDLLESKEFTESASKLTFAVGKDIGGNVIVSDIAKMPHLLIAGATGSGKSVCLNTLIMSILYKAKPEEVKLIMIDPKVVELSIYNGIPHLMIPVVTDPKKASGALNWAVGEMTNRYKSFADFNVRDIKGYNQKMEEMKNSPEYDEILHAPLPQILIAVDELADMMMVAPREVEDSICRLAQLARAAGIHLIIATQRPSVDVITGLIKANMPSRLALAVSSGVDSRTIIDMNGAEKLLGNGDMLFYPQGYQKPLRVQGAYISDSEVGAVAEFLKKQAKGEDFNKEIEEQILSSGGMSGSGGSDDKDELFVEAAQLIIENDKASIGMLQRKLRIGFNRAARIMDQLADAGVVGPEEGTKPRTVLMSMEQFEQYIEESF
ncbi:MAG: DNA translocase FtsK [Lachnospiraceae bacterium]|nr:DNA translocase FtsK [Lachnospiraceae bacterium]